MNKFYFIEAEEKFSAGNKKGSILVRTYKSIIDLMNSYHYFRNEQGKSAMEALSLAK